jgi:hypothetical protein
MEQSFLHISHQTCRTSTKHDTEKNMLSRPASKRRSAISIWFQKAANGLTNQKAAAGHVNKL